MIYDKTNIFLRECMAKTCPGCGFFETDDQSLFCNKCGYPFPRKQPRNQAVPVTTDKTLAQRAALRPANKKTGLAGFFSFDTLTTANHISLIYILGAALIVLVSLMGITGGFAKKGAIPGNMSFTNLTAVVQEPASSFLFWAGFLVIGSILWRMFCELFMVLHRMRGGDGQEEAVESPDETGEYGEGEAAGAGWEGSGQMVECPKCQKIVPARDLRECEHCGIQGCSNCIRMMGLLKKSMTCRECFEAK
jgi:Domain of unknown function (DUF4282)